MAGPRKSGESGAEARKRIEVMADEIERMDLLHVAKPPRDKHLRWVNWKDQTKFATRKIEGYTLVTDEQVKQWGVVCGSKELHDLVLMWIPLERKLALDEINRRKTADRSNATGEGFKAMGERYGIETFDDDSAEGGGK